MPEGFEIRRAWDQAHQIRPASEQPEPDMVAFAKHLQPQISPGAFLLDVGCGRGRNALYLSQAGLNVHACDLSLIALEIAQTRARQAVTAINFQAADLAYLPFANNSFKAAVCVHVLSYHLKADMIEGLCEMRRILQPGGWLYFDLLDCGDDEYGCGQEIEEHSFLDSDGIPVHFSSRQEVREISSGFTLERVTRFELESARHPRIGWVIWAVKY